MPSGKNDFPNQTITLFNSVFNLNYGENLVPLSPTHSRRVGEASSTVVHQFWLTNNTSESVQFTLTVLGMSWNANVVESLDVEADSVKEVEVEVEIPDDAKVESRDRGFLRVSLANDSSTIYTATFETVIGTELPQKEQPQLSWQYWNGNDWTKLTVRDGTENFTRSGLIEFLLPADFSPREDFNLPPRYWLRVNWLSGDYDIEPRLKQVLLNTTTAIQTVTIQNENLGSSEGSEKQTFQTTRQPVLVGQQLEIREPEMPSVLEKQNIEREEGKEAITVIYETTGRPKEIWVRWHQVQDFYQSAARDRHYVLDHLTGKITFGDGRNGLIPPPGKGNIRMSRYQTGGGTAGNKPPGSIVQLKTTVPYVDKVINPEAAAGGAEAETLDSLIERAPKEIRHRQRILEEIRDFFNLYSDEQNQSEGWLFGRDVYISELYQLLEKLEGVDYIPDIMVSSNCPSQDQHCVVAEPIWHKEGDQIGLRLYDHHLPSVRIDPANIVIAPNVNFIPLPLQVSVVGNSATDPNILKRQIKQTLRDFFHPLHRRPGLTTTQDTTITLPSLRQVVTDIEGVQAINSLQSYPTQILANDLIVQAGKVIDWRLSVEVISS